jgi:transposase-like protein
VPQDRNGRFSTEIFERYRRSEKALVAALTQMYIQGVSTRKVTAISEELCGHSFSASAISEINKKLDAELGRFARRELESEYPYLIIDARYEKLRENGVIRSRAVLVAIGIDWEGRRQVLGGGDGQSGEFDKLEGVPAGLEKTRPARGLLRRQRRSSGT